MPDETPDETPQQAPGPDGGPPRSEEGLGGPRPDDGASSSDGPNATFRAALAAVGRFLTHRQMVLFALGLAVGAIAAGAAIGFREGIALVQRLALGFGSERVVTLIHGTPWWRVMLAPAAGGLVVGLIIRYALPERRPQGVADVMEATALKGARMGLGTGLAAAAASIVALGAGASVGREGPVVHLGASLSSWLAQKLNLSRPLAVTLLGCGVASAIAASFNTPIAGVFFALEVVVGHYALSSFAPVVIASVTGTIVTRLYYGNFPAFQIPPRQIVSFLEFPAFALLGVACAFVAVAFIRATTAVEDVANRSAVPQWGRPALAGLVVGTVGIWFPEILGVGYDTTDAAMAERFTFETLVVLLALKLMLTALCLGCGFAGGVFSPALVMGALTGGAFGHVADAAFPHLSSGPGAYTIVGMGAVAGAVLGAPISTILIVFELTSNFTLTIAVMIGVVVASVLTQQATGHSFFTKVLERRGISLAGGRETSLLRARHVSDVMRADFDAVPADTGLPDVRARLVADPLGELFVVAADGSGALAGTITLHDLADAAFDTSRDDALTAKDVARQNPPRLMPDADLETARRALETAGEDHIAVVADEASRRLVGYLRTRDVMEAYNAAVMQARAEERGEV